MHRPDSHESESLQNPSFWKYLSMAQLSDTTTEYPALLDGDEGAYGVVFPDLPGIAAMGRTIDEALASAAEALRDYALEIERDGEDLTLPSAAHTLRIPGGNQLVFIPLAPTPAQT